MQEAANALSPTMAAYFDAHGDAPSLSKHQRLARCHATANSIGPSMAVKMDDSIGHYDDIAP